MDTIRIDYVDSGNAMVACFNLTTVRSWAITYVGKIGKTPPHYKIEVVLLPRRSLSGDGVVDYLDRYEYLFNTFEAANSSITIGNVSLYIKAIKYLSRKLSPKAPKKIEPPPIINYLPVILPEDNLADTATDTLEDTLAPVVAAVAPLTIPEPHKAPSKAPSKAPPKVITKETEPVMVQIETKKATVKAQVVAIMEVPINTSNETSRKRNTIEHLRLSEDVRKAGFLEWSSSCLLSKGIYNIKGITRYTVKELTALVGIKAAQNIIDVLSPNGIYLKD